VVGLGRRLHTSHYRRSPAGPDIKHCRGHRCLHLQTRCRCSVNARGPGDRPRGPSRCPASSSGDPEGIADTACAQAFSSAHRQSRRDAGAWNASCAQWPRAARAPSRSPHKTHGHGALGLHQQRLFKRGVVDLSRVVIGHSGGTTNTGLSPSAVSRPDRFSVRPLRLSGMPSRTDRLDRPPVRPRGGYADAHASSRHDAMVLQSTVPRSMKGALRDWRGPTSRADVIPS